jgi:hypothetical protein
MAKKKNKKKEQGKFATVIGTPTPLLLPARNYRFRVYEQMHTITLPRKGKYIDFNDELFTEKDGEFNLLQYSKSKRAHTIYLPALSKVLFATAQYPDLKDGEAFTPIALVVKKDSIDVIGNLIEMTKETD